MPLPYVLQKISNPIYGYDPKNGQEVEDYKKEGIIAVMAVDNLPCELPKDASEDFGNELIKHVIPAIIGDDPDQIIERASQNQPRRKIDACIRIPQ